MANTRRAAAKMALNAQQIQQLINALQNRNRLGMTSCKATFNGSKELYKVEAFIFKRTEQINDDEGLVYGGLLRNIRKEMARNSFTTFAELLTRARVIEEHQNEIKGKIKYCDHCKMRNHSTMECNRKRQGDYKIESSKSEVSNKDENGAKMVIKCYGRGKHGFVRSNCPDCKPTVNAASVELDFSHVMLSLEAPIPTIPCQINGLAESAFLDTAAKTSIASETLYERLVEKGCKSTFRKANIKLADGKVKKDVIKLIQAVIEIQNRLFDITLVVLSDTHKNRTLLGIDFLERAGIIISPIQRAWWFIDYPGNIFSYGIFKNYDTKDNQEPEKTDLTIGPITKSKKRRLKQFFKLHKLLKSGEDESLKPNDESKDFEFKKPEMLPKIQWSKPMLIDLPIVKKDDEDELTKQCEAALQVIHSKYMIPIKPISPIKSPSKKKLQDLFGSASPPNSPERSITPGRDLFCSESIPDLSEQPKTPCQDLDIVDINMVEIQDEHQLSVEQEIELNKLLKNYEAIFNETGAPCPYSTHKINTGDHLPISNPPYRMSSKKREAMKK